MERWEKPSGLVGSAGQWSILKHHLLSIPADFQALDQQACMSRLKVFGWELSNKQNQLPPLCRFMFSQKSCPFSSEHLDWKNRNSCQPSSDLLPAKTKFASFQQHRVFPPSLPLLYLSHFIVKRPLREICTFRGGLLKTHTHLGEFAGILGAVQLSS